jgi:hypothetical protein
MGFRVLPDFPIVEAKAALPRFGHTPIVLQAGQVRDVSTLNTASAARHGPMVG